MSTLDRSLRAGTPLLLLLLAPLATQCVPRPQVLSPADQSTVDAAAPLTAEIELGTGLGNGSFRVTLLAGIDDPPAALADVTARFSVAGTRASGDFDPAADFRVGRNSLFVSIDRDGDGEAEAVTSASFSYEPGLDTAQAFACDLLDPSHCLLPFPSDFHTREDPASDTGRRVDFAREAMPANLIAVQVDPAEWNRNDGFSPGQAILAMVPDLALVEGVEANGRPIPVPGAVPEWDVAKSLAPDASFLILDWETGERVPLFAEQNARVSPAEGQLLMLRPAVNFESGRRYVVALRNLRNAAGDVIPPQRAFRLYRDGIPSYVDAIEARRPHMDAVLARLEDHGVARDGLYLAWDFTVISKRNMGERLIAMRDDAFAEFGPNAVPDFTITSVEDQPNDSNVRLRIRGTFEVPLYVTQGGATGGVAGPGTRLRCEDAQGTLIPCEGDALPVREGTMDANLFCIVPRAASADGDSPSTPARASLYGHGLLGSGDETFSSHVRAMAGEHNFVFCGTDWIGMAEDDLPTIGVILSDFGRFPTLPDRMQQGLLNFLWLGRLMIHANGLVQHPAFQDSAGNPLIDRSDLFYDGNSQGAIAGGALAAFAQDYTRAVLGVNGMNYSTLLFRSVDFDRYLTLLNFNYLEQEFHPLLFALAQMLWDRTEASGHANHLTADPYPGTPPKTILLHPAFSDHQVSNTSAEVQARTIGASIHTPTFDPAAYADQHPSNEPRAYWPVQPYWNIPAIPTAPPVPAIPGLPDATYRFDGSAMVMWDSGNVQPPQENNPPRPVGNPELSDCAIRFGEDPHECPRRQPAARLQKSEFLRTDGAVVDVCGGEVCLAPLR